MKVSFPFSGADMTNFGLELILNPLQFIIRSRKCQLSFVYQLLIFVGVVRIVTLNADKHPTEDGKGDGGGP